MTPDYQGDPEPPDPADNAEPDSLPPPPSVWSFAERGPGRLGLEAVLGTTAAYILAGALGLEALRWQITLLGSIVAPLALMLTPTRGGIVYRAGRYGGALAVLLTLVVSFSGEGRDRPVDELLLWGLLFFVLGSLAHGAMVLSLDRPAGSRD